MTETETEIVEDEMETDPLGNVVVHRTCGDCHGCERHNYVSWTECEPNGKCSCEDKVEFPDELLPLDEKFAVGRKAQTKKGDIKTVKWTRGIVNDKHMDDEIVVAFEEDFKKKRGKDALISYFPVHTLIPVEEDVSDDN